MIATRDYVVSNDLLLASCFFDIPTEQDQPALTCSFILPENTASLETFFKDKKQAPIYFAGIRSIIDRIKIVATAKRKTANGLEVLYRNIAHEIPPGGNAEEIRKQHFPYTDVSLQLFHDGIKMLSRIAELLESDEITESKKEIVLDTLENEVYVCAPGCYTNIENAYLKLINNPSMRLLAIRTSMAQQLAQFVIQNRNTKLIEELIAKYPRQPERDRVRQRITSGEMSVEQINELLSVENIDGEVIYEGNITHYIAAILNSYRVMLGLNYNHDPLQPQANLISDLLSDFHQAVGIHFTVKNIIDGIVSMLPVDELKEAIRLRPEETSQHLKKFQAELDAYGVDGFFLANALFDAEALANGDYVISRNINSILFLSVLDRLQSKGFLNSHIVSRTLLLSDNAKLIYYPGHDLCFSCVKTERNERFPLAIYVADRLRSGDIDALYYLLDNEHHTALLYKAVIDIIKEDPVLDFVPNYKSDHDLLKTFAVFSQFSQFNFLSKIVDTFSTEQKSSLHRFIDNTFGCRDDVSADEVFNAVIGFLSETSLQCQARRLLIDTVESSEELILLLNFIPLNDRCTYLLTITPERLKNLVKDISGLNVLIDKIPNDDRMPFIHYYRAANQALFVDQPAAEISKLFTMLQPCYYSQLVSALNPEVVRSLISDDEKLKFVVTSMNQGQREAFLRQLGIMHLEQITSNNIVNFAKVMSLIDVCPQLKLLNEWTNGDLAILFKTKEHVLAYLSGLESMKASRFFCALPISLINQCIADKDSLLTVMNIVHPVEYKTLIDTLGVARIREYLPDRANLDDFMGKLDRSQKSAFLKYYASHLSSEQLYIYKDARGVNHPDLFAAWCNSRLQPSNTGLRHVPTQTLFSQPASHLPSAGALSGQRREQATMREFDETLPPGKRQCGNKP